MALDGVHEQRPGHHQRLLVGQQHALAGAHRRQRRQQPRGADDGGHYHVDLGGLGDLAERRLAGAHFGAEPGRRQPFTQPGGVVLGGEYRDRRAV